MGSRKPSIFDIAVPSKAGHFRIVSHNSTVRFSTYFLFPIVSLTAVFFTSCSSTNTLENLSESEMHFVQVVKPLFEHRCSHCHYDGHAYADLDVTNAESVLRGDLLGKAFIVAGSPEKSLLFRALTQPGTHPKAMPGDGWGLTTAQVQQIKAWIETGAEWPPGRAGTIKKRELRVETEGDL